MLASSPCLTTHYFTFCLERTKAQNQGGQVHCRRTRALSSAVTSVTHVLYLSMLKTWNQKCDGRTLRTKSGENIAWTTAKLYRNLCSFTYLAYTYHERTFYHSGIEKMDKFMPHILADFIVVILLGGSGSYCACAVATLAPKFESDHLFSFTPPPHYFFSSTPPPQ